METRPLQDISEAELVRLAQERDPDAFAELMKRNASTSFRLALSILKNRQEALGTSSAVQSRIEVLDLVSYHRPQSKPDESAQIPPCYARSP
jgi:hypothetical protein